MLTSKIYGNLQKKLLHFFDIDYDRTFYFREIPLILKTQHYSTSHIRRFGNKKSIHCSVRHEYP